MSSSICMTCLLLVSVDLNTLAGGVFGFKDGNGTAAQFRLPVGIDIDSNSNIYVADGGQSSAFPGNNAIRVISPSGI